MSPYTLHRGNSLEVLRTLGEASFDAIVTDPPYELTSARPGGRSEATRGKVMGGFMGLAWDATGVANDPATWREALRVLKPGGHLLAFSGTRTYHRMVCAIEDAGFEVRDMIPWHYASGFPKSRNIAEHDMEGEDAERWAGWGTALKPATEPIVVARKPLAKGCTVAANVLQFGTGALNIDGCRVATTDDLNGGAYAETGGRTVSGSLNPSGMNVPGKTVGREFEQPTGRWPANLIHDGSDEVLAAFPQAPGQLANVSATAPIPKTSNVFGRMNRTGEASAGSDNEGAVGFKMKPGVRRLDAGSAARFFYCAKASKSDRGDGNTHPTVKPTDLMRYLCRLVTPPGGVVLDPFMGSGSTGKAAILEGFRFVGIDLDEDGEGNPIGYVEIARARIGHAWNEVLAARRAAEEKPAVEQFDMFGEPA